MGKHVCRTRWWQEKYEGDLEQGVEVFGAWTASKGKRHWIWLQNNFLKTPYHKLLKLQVRVRYLQ